MTHLEETFAWLSYADETLQDARDNFRLGKYGVAVSLAYYATFYAAKSVIAFHRGRDPKTHTGVGRRFGELAVQGSDFPPAVARHLSVLAGRRGKVDYDLGYRETLEAGEAESLLDDAQTFVTEVHHWLSRHHRQ